MRRSSTAPTRSLRSKPSRPSPSPRTSTSWRNIPSRSSAGGRTPSSRGPSSTSSSRPRDGRCSGGMDSDDVPFLERRPARGDDHFGVLPAFARRRAGVDFELERPGGGSSPSPPPPGAPPVAGDEHLQPDPRGRARLVGRLVGGAASGAALALPLSAPGLVGGAAMSWARSLGEFGATLLFAGNLTGRTQTLPLAVYTAMESDLRAAQALALIMVVVAFAMLLVLRRMAREAGDA